MLDFDQISIAVAVLLTAMSLRQFRIINIVMLVNFGLFALTDKLVPDDQLMILQTSYVIIGIITVKLLTVLKASPPLYVTTLLFSLYNLGIISEILFFGQGEMYNNFVVVAQSQMIIELLIMFITGIGGFYVCRGLHPKSNYIHTISRFFRVGPRVGIEGVA